MNKDNFNKLVDAWTAINELSRVCDTKKDSDILFAVNNLVSLVGKEARRQITGEETELWAWKL